MEINACDKIISDRHRCGSIKLWCDVSTGPLPYVDKFANGSWSFNDRELTESIKNGQEYFEFLCARTCVCVRLRVCLHRKWAARVRQCVRIYFRCELVDSRKWVWFKSNAHIDNWISRVGCSSLAMVAAMVQRMELRREEVVAMSFHSLFR